MKDEVKIRVYDKLDKQILKHLLFLLKLTILKNELLFYITNNIKNLLFSTIYINLFPHFLYKNLVFYITKILLNFIKLQKHY